MKTTTVSDVIDVPAKRPDAELSGEVGQGKVLGAQSRGFRESLAAVLGTIAATPWSWLVVTCVILAISGGLRYGRERQLYGLTDESRISPFPLAELPQVVGDWRNDGTEYQLDPEIARIAGSSDHFVRRYTNAKTGDTAAVLVIYGLASTVCFHTPEICYPSAGFSPAGTEPVSDHELKIPGVDKTAIYRQAFFSRSLAGRAEYDEVEYSFRHAGEWMPVAADRWKAFRFHPGMFKVQISRTVNDPSVGHSAGVDLLGEFMREIELRLASRGKASAPPAQTDRKPAPGKSAK